MSYFGKFLIIESDPKILNVIFENQSLQDQYPCIVARSINDGVNTVERFGKEIRFIFISERLARICDMSGFWRLLEKELKDTPVVLIEDKVADALVRQQIPDRIAAPGAYIDFVNRVISRLQSDEDWKKCQNDGVEKDKELQAQDEMYVGVLMRDFISTPQSFFNIYIRLSLGKYIKIVNAGDPLPSDVFDRFSLKGIDEFYVPKVEHEKYVRLQATVTNKIVQTDGAFGFKVKAVIKLGARVTDNLFKCGITPQRLDNAQLYLNQTVQVLRHMRIKNEVVINFLKNIEQQEHSSAVTFISSILSTHLGFESTKSVTLVGTAALLHDIGLYDLDPNYNESSEIKDEKQKEIFAKHAVHGAEILRSTKLFDEIVCHAVENHHRRRKGDNAGRRSSSVNLVTEIISVSDEFFSTVISPGYSQERVRIFMENELKNYSPNVERAFHLLTKGRKAG